ncbi:uncharacterized protein LOC120354553 [Nilaparvata lugens]|uniref:uncharacterized protein LOC120354553 n=1 Tax=Nilaparvata lugens TaxID=108931 RepID=UPI00193D533D|nr:uncharacterized protein LOC120354553 [Nilaparvata lugens]
MADEEWCVVDSSDSPPAKRVHFSSACETPKRGGKGRGHSIYFPDQRVIAQGRGRGRQIVAGGVSAESSLQQTSRNSGHQAEASLILLDVTNSTQPRVVNATANNDNEAENIDPQTSSKRYDINIMSMAMDAPLLFYLLNGNDACSVIKRIIDLLCTLKAMCVKRVDIEKCFLVSLCKKTFYNDVVVNVDDDDDSSNYVHMVDSCVCWLMVWQRGEGSTTRAGWYAGNWGWGGAGWTGPGRAGAVNARAVGNAGWGETGSITNHGEGGMNDVAAMVVLISAGVLVEVSQFIAAVIMAYFFKGLQLSEIESAQHEILDNKDVEIEDASVTSRVS